MGLLLNQQYWARIANQLHVLRPRPGILMPEARVMELVDLACRTFSDLLLDPDLERDLSLTSDFGSLASTRLGSTPLLDDFLIEFLRFEKPILIQSGVTLHAAADLLSSVRDLSGSIASAQLTVDEAKEKLEQLRDLACGFHFVGSTFQPIGAAKRLAQGLSGSALMAINAITIIKSPAGGDSQFALSVSVTVGWDLIKKAIRLDSGPIRT